VKWLPGAILETVSVSMVFQWLLNGFNGFPVPDGSTIEFKASRSPTIHQQSFGKSPGNRQRKVSK
jgi:hypothetical protein